MVHKLLQIALHLFVFIQALLPDAVGILLGCRDYVATSLSGKVQADCHHCHGQLPFVIIVMVSSLLSSFVVLART